MQRWMIDLARLITNTFFRRIDVVGREHVPAEGPVIFAGNHPNALMDGWLLMARCGRQPVRFLAHAKLWTYPVLGPLLDLSGTIPVYRREEHGHQADNSAAFASLHAALAAGDCLGIFPEGVSHVESRLAKLKTGTARVALEAAANNRIPVTIVPCGLNYLHRHRFRSQVLLEFGAPIRIDEARIADFRDDAEAAVRVLTDDVATALAAVTLNAPDWSTLRFAQISRRLYKPSSARLTPAQYVELNRRFVAGYLQAPNDPDVEAYRRDAEDYQARLDMLGIKDYQLRKPVPVGKAARRITGRALMMLLLLPLAIPAALIQLPIAWAAGLVGTKFSYEKDDEATLKVLATLALLPVIYLVIIVLVGSFAGWAWALAAAVALVISTAASMRLLEAEAGLLVSTLSLLRIVRLEQEIGELRERRAELVERIRALVDSRVSPELERMFDSMSFGVQAAERDTASSE